MGLKKTWIYDSPLPQPLADELMANGYHRGKWGSSSDFTEKHAEMEEYSISALGDMESDSTLNWPRISVATYATELKIRRKKYHAKSARSVSLGSSNYYQEHSEAGQSISSYSVLSRSIKPSSRIHKVDHKRYFSEPINLDSIDDLLKHLKRIGCPKPESSPIQSISRLPSLTGSDSDADLSFGSECDFSDPDIGDTTQRDDGSTSLDELKVVDDATTSQKTVDRETEELISILSRSCSGTTNKSIRSTNVALTASLRAFAAYHLEKKNDSDLDLELGTLLGIGTNGKEDGERFYRQETGPLCSSSPSRSRKARKGIPSWV